MEIFAVIRIISKLF